MEVKRMPRSKFLKLTCQDFWKPMDIEKKVSENKCNTKKINIFKKNTNAINSLQSVKPV